MGALSQTPRPRTPEAALKIHHALEQTIHGHTLDFHRLHHALRGTNSDALTQILIGLTHHTAQLHDETATTPRLKQLVQAALAIDLLTIVPVKGQDDKKSALNEFMNFLQNLVSAHAEYVEPAIKTVTRFFTLPSNMVVHVIPHVSEFVTHLLRTHVAATESLTRIIRQKHPHPIRSAEDHSAYMRLSLHVARTTYPSVAAGIICGVMEKVGAVESLVPGEEEIGEEEECLEVSKMDAVLCELFRHFDSCKKEEHMSDTVHVDDVFTQLELFYNAYESYIVPTDALRFAPLALLYGAHVAGETHAMIERFRVCFHDSSQSAHLRGRYLQHSAFIVMRSMDVEDEHVRQWCRKLSRWLHLYLDALLHNGRVTPDADLHRSFYIGFSVFMEVVSFRKSAFVGDELDAMRVYRLALCPLKPIQIIVGETVEKFIKVAEDLGIAVTEGLQGSFIPNRTRFSRRNEVVWNWTTSKTPLPQTRLHLGKQIRWQEDSSDGNTSENRTI